jgi:hypothetical protein
MITAAQREYRINHSELRGLARSNASFRGVSKTTALAEVCKDRAHWLGDKWSKPSSSEGAKAALLVLRDRGGDPLPHIARARAMLPADQLPAFLRIRHALRHLWTARR